MDYLERFTGTDTRFTCLVCLCVSNLRLGLHLTVSIGNEALRLNSCYLKTLYSSKPEFERVSCLDHPFRFPGLA